MPDAREMLKKLAKDKRHKRVEIRVPDEPTRPAPLKKIKRTGATRPYQLVEPEKSEEDPVREAEAVDRSGAVAASSSDLPEHEGQGTFGLNPEAEDHPPTYPTPFTSDSTADQSSFSQELVSKYNRKSQQKNPAEAFIELATAENGTTCAAGLPSYQTELESRESVAVLDDAASTTPLMSSAHAKPRSRGRTVTNLAKRSLIQPDWQVDLTRDEGFLRGHFRDVFGKGKMAKEVDLYCQLYAEACRRKTITLHFLSVELGELVGSASNGTIRARLLAAEKLGLLVQQGFNNETKDYRRGTYIHLRCPWI